MSVEKKVTFNEHGEPRVTVTIEGWDDAFRFAWALGHLQVEFADIGRRIGGSLRKKLGAADFKAWHKRCVGNETIHWAREDNDAEELIASLGLSRPLPGTALNELSADLDVEVWVRT